jgi:hypothetical protein
MEIGNFLYIFFYIFYINEYSNRIPVNRATPPNFFLKTFLFIFGA